MIIKICSGYATEATETGETSENLYLKHLNIVWGISSQEIKITPFAIKGSQVKLNITTR